VVRGPGGIGKTSLLEVIADEAATAPGHAPSATVVRLDGRSLPASPRAVTEVLGQHITVPPENAEIAPAAGRLVLLVDAYERLEPLDDWFRTGLLPRLPSDALVVLAGRMPPGPAWRADAGWRDLLRVVSLRNLDPDESRHYLAACGVPEPAHDGLVDITRGHPLGLSLLADVVLRGGEATLGPAAPDLVGTLGRRFVDVVPDDVHRSALEVCSLAWVTTEDLLRDAGPRTMRACRRRSCGSQVSSTGPRRSCVRRWRRELPAGPCVPVPPSLAGSGYSNERWAARCSNQNPREASHVDLPDAAGGVEGVGLVDHEIGAGPGVERHGAADGPAFHEVAAADVVADGGVHDAARGVL
jgi:hypothetical protein